MCSGLKLQAIDESQNYIHRFILVHTLNYGHCFSEIVTYTHTHTHTHTRARAHTRTHAHARTTHAHIVFMYTYARVRMIFHYL